MGDAQVLGLVEHGAAFEAQPRHRTAACVGVAEARADPEEGSGVGAIEEGLREQGAVGVRVAGDAGDVGAPVGDHAADGEGQGGGAAEAGLPVGRGAEAAFDEPGRLDDRSEA